MTVGVGVGVGVDAGAHSSKAPMGVQQLADLYALLAVVHEVAQQQKQQLQIQVFG